MFSQIQLNTVGIEICSKKFKRVFKTCTVVSAGDYAATHQHKQGSQEESGTEQALLYHQY